MTARPVLVDCDPGLLVWGLDVDDDLALLFLLGSPEVEVVGVTTAYGNTSSHLCHRDARRLMGLAGRPDVPVHRGAGWLTRTSRPTEASHAIVEAARRHAGELTILAIAPHTNLAAALAEEPRLGTLVKELVLMGGCVKDGTRQFNFSADPAATRAVLEMGCPTVMLTNELCLSVAMTPADVRRLAVDGSLIRLFVPRLKRFARFQSLYRGRNGGDPGEALGGFHPWDVVAAAWLVAPELFREVEELRPTVEDAGHVRVEGGAAVVRAPRSLDVPRFLDLMVSRLTAVRAG